MASGSWPNLQIGIWFLGLARLWWAMKEARMDRRTFVSLIASGIVTGNMPDLASSTGDRFPRPNFLFMIADDLTFVQHIF